MTRPVALNYTVRGEGRPLVLLHGLYGSAGNLNRFAKHFAERYRVIAPDLRNHGHSPHHPRMDYPAMAADIAALLDAEGEASAAVVGHSMGGKVAMTLALAEPRRVDAVVAADIAPVAYQHGHATLVATMRGIDVAAASSRGEVDAALAKGVESQAVRQFLLKNLAPDPGGGYRWRIPLDILSGAVSVIEGFPDLEGGYPGPALFVYGERSDYFDADRDGARTRALFPAAELVMLRETGHWLHAERPEEFAAALDRFFARHYPAGG